MYNGYHSLFNTSSIPCAAQWGNISSDDVPILQKEDIKSGNIKLKGIKKIGHYLPEQ